MHSFIAHTRSGAAALSKAGGPDADVALRRCGQGRSGMSISSCSSADSVTSAKFVSEPRLLLLLRGNPREPEGLNRLLLYRVRVRS